MINHKPEEGKVAGRSAAVLSVLILPVLLLSCASREDRIVAKVGEKAIAVVDVERVFRPQVGWSPEQLDSARMATLNRLIDDKILALEGERMGYRADEQIVTDSEEAKRRGMINELYQRVVVERARVDEWEVKRYYDRLAEEVKTRHILLPTKEMADSVYDQLTREGKTFNELASERSTDNRTKTRGGDLGWLGWGRMPDEFQTVAFSLKIGETSRPVKTRMGYHIIRVEDRREAERRPYAEERERIRKQLETTEMRRIGAHYLERATERARIQVDEDVLRILAEKTPKQERKMFSAPPLPAVTDEDKEKVLVSSALGDWTVGKVLEEAGKSRRRPSFSQLDNAKRYVASLITYDLLVNEAKRFHFDRSRKVNLDTENTVDNAMAGKFTREEIDTKAEASEDELIDYYNAHIDRFTRGEKVQPFEDVKKRIENMVLAEKREKLRKEVVSRLREETEVVINRRNLGLVGASP